MNKDIPFNKEEFINECPCLPCTTSRQLLLDKIEQYRETDPEMSKHLEWYRDRLWQDQIKAGDFREMLRNRGEDQLNKDTAAALRAMADKLEESGMHFMIRCVLPTVPIFSGKDDHDRYGSYIEVAIVAGPLGG
jgi:hypothetical protein